MIASITGDVKLMDTAESFARTVVSLPAVIPFYTSMVRATLALSAVQRGDVAAAREQYAALESIPGIMLLYISTDRVLGILSATLGWVDQAVAHFEDALTFCRKAGYRPELAWTCHDYAEALLQRNNSGDRTKTMSLSDEALSSARELGMRPLMERVLALQERAQSQPTKALAYPDGLTQREVEVLRLIALGKSNREIAEELVISLNTVLRHVSHIFTKTGATNRVEVATYASRHELTP